VSTRPCVHPLTRHSMLLLLQAADYLQDDGACDACATQLADLVVSEGWIDPGNSEALHYIQNEPDALLVAIAARCTGELEPLLADVLPLHAAAVRSRCMPIASSGKVTGRGQALKFVLNGHKAGAALAQVLPQMTELAALQVMALDGASARNSVALARSIARCGATVRMRPETQREKFPRCLAQAHVTAVVHSISRHAWLMSASCSQTQLSMSLHAGTIPSRFSCSQLKTTQIISPFLLDRL
jgi:hypothetical protein